MEIDLAESWLQRAEIQLATDGEANRESARLLVATAEGQLVKVRALQARLEAEQALEAERHGYVRLGQEVARVREKNAALRQRNEGSVR